MKAVSAGLAVVFAGAFASAVSAQEREIPEFGPLDPSVLLKEFVTLPSTPLLPIPFIKENAPDVAEPVVKIRDLFSVLDQRPSSAIQIMATDIIYLRYADLNGPVANGSGFKTAFFDYSAEVVCLQKDNEKFLPPEEAKGAIIPFECRDVTTLSPAFVEGFVSFTPAEGPYKSIHRDVYKGGAMSVVNVGGVVPIGAQNNLHTTRWDVAAKQVITSIVQFSDDGKNILSTDISTKPMDVGGFVVGVMIDHTPEETPGQKLKKHMLMPPLSIPRMREY